MATYITPTARYPDITGSPFTPVGLPTVINGVIGSSNALRFSGVGQYATSTLTPLVGGGDVDSSVAVTLTFDSADVDAGTQDFLAQRLTTTDRALQLQVRATTGNLRCWFFGAGNVFTYAEIAAGMLGWDDGTPHRIGFKVDTVTNLGHIYINGVEATSYTAQPAGTFVGFIASADDLSIGAWIDGSSPFEGDVDTPSFWLGTGLTEDNFLADYQLEFGLLSSTDNTITSPILEPILGPIGSRILS